MRWWSNIDFKVWTPIGSSNIIGTDPNHQTSHRDERLWALQIWRFRGIQLAPSRFARLALYANITGFEMRAGNVSLVRQSIIIIDKQHDEWLFIDTLGHWLSYLTTETEIADSKCLSQSYTPKNYHRKPWCHVSASFCGRAIATVIGFIASSWSSVGNPSSGFLVGVNNNLTWLKPQMIQELEGTRRWLANDWDCWGHGREWLRPRRWGPPSLVGIQHTVLFFLFKLLLSLSLYIHITYIHIYTCIYIHIYAMLCYVVLCCVLQCNAM